MIRNCICCYKCPDNVYMTRLKKKICGWISMDAPRSVHAYMLLWTRRIYKNYTLIKKDIIQSFVWNYKWCIICWRYLRTRFKKNYWTWTCSFRKRSKIWIYWRTKFKDVRIWCKQEYKNSWIQRKSYHHVNATEVHLKKSR